jgi:hypothetical protein
VPGPEPAGDHVENRSILDMIMIASVTHVPTGGMPERGGLGYWWGRPGS